MFDTLDGNRDILPIYPSTIQGELRIILQVKDEFLLCFKHLESLRNLWDQQNRIITKEFIIEQIKSGESEIEQLESELSAQKDLLTVHERHNDALIIELKNYGERLVADSSVRRIKSCRTTLFRSCHLNLSDVNYIGKDPAFVSVLETIASRIDAAQIELKENLRPLLEFYKDLFYLQLHFTLALTQISCYCMPLMTDSISLVDRLFFWTERPEFELIKRSGQICDRLRDIYTRLQRILGRLLDSVLFLQDRIDMQRLLEIKFYDKMRQLNQLKDDLLEEIHLTRLNLDLYEEENDRLVGTLVKIDPLFVEKDAFVLYAEHKNTMSTNLRLSNLAPNNNYSDIKFNLKESEESTKPLSIGGKKQKSQSTTSTVTELETLENANNIANTSNIQILFENPTEISNSKESFPSSKIAQWRKHAFKLLTKMRKTYSKSESNLVKFMDFSTVSREQSTSSNIRSTSSKKYVIEVINESKSSSTCNQTTDAFVLTSDILPKDE